MTATQAGRSAAPVHSDAHPAHSAPPHYLRRVARFIVLRAALRGRLNWPTALATLARIDGTARPVQARAARAEGGEA